ncbi:metallophosphoesterase, partial [Streptococcus danieliae]|nr:metallophosphoesterase [Streptococcus danieliae]
MIKKILLTTTILSIAYLYQNRYIKKRKYIISDKKISQSFNGFKIIQLSDIHCGKLGFSDQIFLKNIKKEKADIIVITGDILDSYRNDSACAYNILSQISDI